MRANAALLPLKHKFKRIYAVPVPATRRAVATSTPRKQGNNDPDEKGLTADEKTGGPIVAFSRLPPLPPFLGPLVALDFLDRWSNRDDEEN